MTAQDYISNKNLSRESDRDIAGVLWYDENINQVDQINISFELFERSPEYGILAELKMAYSEMKPIIKTELWIKYKHYLKSGTDEQKERIQYSLWVDFFEDQGTVDEAWSKLIDDNSDIQTIRQVLSISGPVPFEKKEKLYSKLISDIQNHESILDSLVGSFYDVFGQIEIEKSRKILSTLEVDKDLEKYSKLNDHLNRFNSQRELREYLKMKKDDNT